MSRVKGARSWLKAHERLARLLAYLVLAGAVAYGFHAQEVERNERHAVQQLVNAELKARQKKGLINRAVNVETWCGAINSIDTYDRLLVRKASGGAIAYTLRPFPCVQIIRETLESGKGEPLVTAADHPLVYAAQQQLLAQR